MIIVHTTQLKAEGFLQSIMKDHQNTLAQNQLPISFLRFSHNNTNIMGNMELDILNKFLQYDQNLLDLTDLQNLCNSGRTSINNTEDFTCLYENNQINIIGQNIYQGWLATTPEAIKNTLDKLKNKGFSFNLNHNLKYKTYSFKDEHKGDIFKFQNIDNCKTFQNIQTKYEKNTDNLLGHYVLDLNSPIQQENNSLHQDNNFFIRIYNKILSTIKNILGFTDTDISKVVEQNPMDNSDYTKNNILRVLVFQDQICLISDNIDNEELEELKKEENSKFQTTPNHKK